MMRCTYFLPCFIGALATTPVLHAQEDDDAASDSGEASDGDSGDGDGDGEASAEADVEAKLALDDAPPPDVSEKFASAQGVTGAGLTFSPDQKIRAWGELSFHTQSAFTVVAPVIGAGYKVTRAVELELILPMSFASYDVDVNVDGIPENDSKFVFGNPYFGVNYLRSHDKLRYKAGAGFTIPVIPEEAGAAAYGASGARGAQEHHLYRDDSVSIVTPVRVEYLLGKVIASADAALGIYVPTDDKDTELSLSLAPGAGTYFGGNILVGARLPLIWIFTESEAQFAFEPYGRFDFGSAFATARFTLNIDEPFGFSFDDGRIWGLHLGGGASF